MSWRVKGSRAFTLRELLVVTALIAVLMAVLTPALRAARELATGSVCLNNQKSLTTAYVMYADDNDGRIPPGFVVQSDLPLWAYPPMTEAGGWATSGAITEEDRIRGVRNGSLFSYVSDPRLYHCPGDNRMKLPTQGEQRYRSYILPDVLGAESANSNARGRHQHIVMKLQEIKQPGMKYLFMESEFRHASLTYDHGGWTFAPWQNSSTWWDQLGTFHKNSATFGFADGHAERHTWAHKETWLAFSEDSFGKAIRPDISENEDVLWLWRHYPYLSANEQPPSR